MNREFPPLPMPRPQTETRRSERPRPVPLSPEVLARRGEIARRLKEQITPLSEGLRSMTDTQRRAVFYKLEHEGPVNLTGTGLKPVAEPSETYTLAVPVDEDLSRLTNKIDQFETAVPRQGVVTNSRLVTALQTIQLGEPTDRLSQELLENYQALIAQERVICEIELLSLQQGVNQQRNELQDFRHALQAELDRDRGIGALFEQEEIKGTVRAVIRCTGGLLKKLVEDQDWQRRIYWFEARPEFQTFHSVADNFTVENLGPITSPPDDAPVVCIVDTGVTAGNPFLQPVVREDLLKSFLKSVPNNPSDEYGHGSGVASLAAYYALNPMAGGENAAKVWIASARILDANNQLEDDRLFSSLLKQVVMTFVPLGIRIFNLSVNVRNLSWNKNAKRTHPRRSWVARTIDQLSREHDIIFVVSTGNIITLDVRNFHEDGKPYPAYFVEDDACILDPGQAALALTVGSLAPTTLAEGRVGRARAIALQDEASPFTRSGPGIRKEVKPELMDYGGNYLLDEEGGQVRANRSLGLAMASHHLTPAIRYDSGTSYAAPRTTYKLAMIMSDLRPLGILPSASLLKAFLINSARYPLGGDDMERFKQSVGSSAWLNVLGYGMPDDVRATYCDSHSVLMFYQGEIKPGEISFLDIPVPGNLASTGRNTKRLTVTVVFSPEVQRWGLEQYLGTGLKWRVFRGDGSRDAVVSAMSANEDENDTQDESDAEEIDQGEELKELKFELGITKRSRGSIQHDVAEWSVHKAEFSTHNYTLSLTAFEKWGRTNLSPVPFAVVVRLEDTSQTVNIFTEVDNAFVAIEIESRAVRR